MLARRAAPRCASPHASRRVADVLGRRTPQLEGHPFSAAGLLHNNLGGASSSSSDCEHITSAASKLAASCSRPARGCGCRDQPRATGRSRRGIVDSAADPSVPGLFARRGRRSRRCTTLHRARPYGADVLEIDGETLRAIAEGARGSTASRSPSSPPPPAHGHFRPARSPSGWQTGSHCSAWSEAIAERQRTLRVSSSGPTSSSPRRSGRLPPRLGLSLLVRSGSGRGGLRGDGIDGARSPTSWRRS